MFTFSFSSAFAAVEWTGEATSKYLTEAKDYTAPTAAGEGEEGITEAYRAKLLAEAEAIEDAIDDATLEAYTFYAPEEAEALKLIATYKEAIKTVKTAEKALALKKEFNGATDVTVSLAAPEAGSALAKIDTAKAVRTAAFNTTTGIAANTDAIDLTRVVDRYAASTDFYLPGYTTLLAGDTKNIHNDKKLYFGANGTVQAIFAAGNYTVDNTYTTVEAVIDWFMDNDYRDKTDLNEGVSAFRAALVAITNTYKDTVSAEKNAIQDEIYKYVDKAAAAAHGTIALSELEGVEALVKKIDAFGDKYEGLMLDGSTVFTSTLKEDGFKTATTGVVDKLAVSYFDQYCAEVSAVPEVKKLTDADKTKVLELYNKVNALLDVHEDVWDYVGITEISNTYACNYTGLKAAYEDFLKKDVKAFNNLDDFTVLKTTTVGTTTKAYFDASEKNVNALKAQRTAFDALVKDYGYDDLNDVTSGLTYDQAAAKEAKILAAEFNMPADAEYDVKDTTKLQNYLNNATLKVTTNALGNNKIRVQARFDADTYKDIVAECGNDYTISYQFYHKTAAAKTYKASTVKDRNYITYTSKSLKKGTKYKFQCAVLIKDAAGNVVAQKDYKASTIGSRVCR